MTTQAVHRLQGLEPDNLLAFLALLGTLRAIACERPDLQPRVSWSIDEPPLRPLLHLGESMDRESLAETVARGLDKLAMDRVFGDHADLNFTQDECRSLLDEAAKAASVVHRGRADLLAALMSDAAIKNGQHKVIDPTPLCLLFGQGHQHFLARLKDVPALAAPPARGRGKQAVTVTPAKAIEEALFDIWHRTDPTPSFRWDPAEDVRYATMGGDPTDPAFKAGTQHGANRLAAVALPAMKLATRARAGRVRPTIAGGQRDREGFSIAWPIWHAPTSLAGIEALLLHPDLRAPGQLAHLGVVDVLVAQRISVGKFMNFTRARPVS